MSPTHDVQSTMTSPAPNAPHKTESPIQRLQQFPGHNINVQSPVVHSTSLCFNCDTRSRLYSTHSSAMVQSPTQTSPYLGHNVQPLGHASQCRIQPAPRLVQRMSSLTQNSQVPAYNAHVVMQSMKFPIPERVPEQNRPLLEQNSASNDHSPKPPNHDTIEATPADLAVKCYIPECEKPVYYDGTVKSDYCSQQHRQYV
ncbi:hypothetical protein C0995_002414 [Termitomyces sp. Mi166|nr:hypothetical protein C0995_002414 [Termitomyces sp. Mi166\